MRFDKFAFGSIQIDGSTYEHDVVIDRGEIRKRKKKPSKKFRDEFGQTPLSVEEKIPCKCQRLVVGTGPHGGLPVMGEVRQEAQRGKVELLVLRTAEAIRALQQDAKRRQRSAPRDLLALTIGPGAAGCDAVSVCTIFVQLTPNTGEA
jgi:hypothetical protein